MSESPYLRSLPFDLSARIVSRDPAPVSESIFGAEITDWTTRPREQPRPMMGCIAFWVVRFWLLLLSVFGSANAADFKADCEFPFTMRLPDFLSANTEYNNSLKQRVRETLAKRSADPFSSGTAVFPFYPNGADVSCFESFRKDYFFVEAIVFRIQVSGNPLATLQQQLSKNMEKGREIGDWSFNLDGPTTSKSYEIVMVDARVRDDQNYTGFIFDPKRPRFILMLSVTTLAGRRVEANTTFRSILDSLDIPSTADTQPPLSSSSQNPDIVDLIKERKIEVETTGGGIQNVVLRLRKTVAEPLTVRVPVGTFFVSERPAAQNMVITTEKRISLTTADWQSVSLPAACANRPREIPNATDTFVVERSPYQPDLVRLMPVLDKAGVNFATRQAAVWIVTDNASYSDLGSLISRSTATPSNGGERIIREIDAAHAMKICDEAGIVIRSKRIWRDKDAILRSLTDATLKTWLVER